MRQLDKFDDSEQGPFRVVTERAPIIARFLAEELTTDGVQLAVDGIIAHIGQEHSVQREEPLPVASLQEIRWQERVTTLLKRFASWQKLVGDQLLYPEERQTLIHLAQEIQESLARTPGEELG